VTETADKEPHWAVENMEGGTGLFLAKEGFAPLLVSGEKFEDGVSRSVYIVPASLLTHLLGERAKSGGGFRVYEKKQSGLLGVLLECKSDPKKEINTS
jgi:hypothetical protein